MNSKVQAVCDRRTMNCATVIDVELSIVGGRVEVRSRGRESWRDGCMPQTDVITGAGLGLHKRPLDLSIRAGDVTTPINLRSTPPQRPPNNGLDCGRVDDDCN